MEEQRNIQKRIAESAVKSPKLLERVGTVDAEMEKKWSGAKIYQGWEPLVGNTAKKVTGKKVVACNGAVKWRGEEVKEAGGVWREAHARCTSSKRTVAWEYTKARKELK